MPAARHYPVYLDLRGRLAVVVGGHQPGEAKVQGLLEAGARVRLVTRCLTSTLSLLVQQGRIEHLARPYRRGDLEGAFLALSVLADAEVNQVFWEEAEELGIPANVMDDTERCSFIAPAIFRRGDLAVAISTGGSAPALAVRLKERLEGLIGQEYARFLEWASALRKPLALLHPRFGVRREIWYRLVDSDVLELLERGETDSARRRVQEITGVLLPNPKPTRRSHAA